MNRFKMIARDNNSNPTQYRTWVTWDEPDFNGSQYTGLKSGITPFDNITIDVITDDGYVADFNLPNPLNWLITEKVLPANIYDSQLAIIDGYAYLFGGGGTDKIFKSDLNNPADWIDTGAVLPSVISNSQLAIVDDTIYLFGGNDGSKAVDNIYSAPLLDPLSWTDNGASLLPNKVQDAQLTIFDGYLYLLGGRNESQVFRNILIAPTSNPLSWSVGIDGYTLSPLLLNEPLYSSHVGLINDTIYLFGGFNSAKTPTAKIYSANIANLSNWSVAGLLPYPAFNGQFFTIGSRGYLIAPTDSSVSFTKVFRCELAFPYTWVDTKHTVPGEIYGPQLGIIGDRLFLFGGNANSCIYADDSILEYSFTYEPAASYGDVTRTQVSGTPDRLDLFKVLGFPYWKTSYVS